jgi:hypothetical protein
MKSLVRGSKFALPDRVVSQYNYACSAAVRDVLLHGKEAACQSADPTGLDALNLAKRVRRSLKTLARQGRITPRLQKQIESIDRERYLDTIRTPLLHATPDS